MSLTKKKKAKLTPPKFPIVGVGASAGGLEAFKVFVSSLPLDTGMAFVLIQHLDRKHESMLAEILSRLTRLSVTEVKNGVIAEPNNLYVIPSNCSMEIKKGVLKLLPRPEIPGKQRVIDFFFQSLALDQGEMGIGIVFSGTGDDGTEGLMAIKSAGGITIAQDPGTAKFKDMPQKAIDTGIVDLILPPEEIAAELIEIGNNHFKLPDKTKQEVIHNNSLMLQKDLNIVFQLLSNICHVDFSHYKKNTFERRLKRRIAFHHKENLANYVNYLSENPKEVKALYADILIHVTQFFRDKDAHSALSQLIYPKLIKDRLPTRPIRIWIPGCSTGEEVYSIAISLIEYLETQSSQMPIQIFATDISEQSISIARSGEYPPSINQDVSPERLKKFFIKLDNGNFKITKSVRDLCLFSRHDLTIDPPFAKIDLISCRNLMIYLTVYLQKQVIPIFHYALNPGGFLWLGRAETVGDLTTLFSSVDKINKIYERKNVQNTLSVKFPVSTYTPDLIEEESKNKIIKKNTLIDDFQKFADLALQEEYPGVFINGEMEILQFRGKTSLYIEPMAGIASHNLLKMVRPELATIIRMLILVSKKKNHSVKKEGISYQLGSRQLTFNLKVIPVSSSTIGPVPLLSEHYYLILFENTLESIPLKIEKGNKKKKTKGTTSEYKILSSHLNVLETEMQASKDYQHALIEKYENIQEDFSTANEELQSTNEEIQSANEELETAKEELQSSNEELITINDELQTRSLNQIQLNNDLVNLLGSVDIPILMLDNEHRIRRFTPLAGKALNLIASDVGRPISDLKQHFTSPEMNLDLEVLVSEVQESLNSKEIEVQNAKGHWFRLQIKPYKTIENKIDGSVMALVDIDILKQSLKEVKKAKSEAEKANRAKDLFLATLSHELRTPLSSILAWVQLMRLGRLSPEKNVRAIRIIEESGKVQAQLIDDLLDISRIVSGKIVLDLNEISPIEAILPAIESVRFMAEKKSIEIKTNFDLNVGTVMADSTRLQQIIWNLLTNAIKFSNPNSEVSINLLGLRENGKLNVKIQVVDYGKGVDEKFLPFIFDRFSQEDSSSIRLHGGLGLGLAIVQNLVELHNGVIKCEKPDEKPGSIFSVILPIKTPKKLSPIHVRNENDNVRMANVNLQGSKILIVDDEVNPREAFKELIDSFGAETKTASSAKEAFALLQVFKPDLLVSDIAMPEEDGCTLIKIIRKLPESEGGKIPAIALTAYAAKDEINYILSSGFDAHIAKPFNGLFLLETIDKLIKRSRH